MDNKISGGVKSSHHLHIENKNKVTVTGVHSVVNMNERMAVLAIDGGTLTVKGSGIVLNKLSVDDGNLILEAQSIESASYTGKGSPLLKRLFK
jgi:sporulation protein YabP